MRPECPALPLVALVALASLCACERPNRTVEVLNEVRRREPTRVRVEPVVREEMVKTLTTTTVVESENEIRIFPRVTGIVVEVHVEEGDRVEEGQLLALIDARDSAAVLAEMTVAVREAEDRIETAKVMKREAQSRVEGLKISWEQAARDYERNEKNKGLISESALDGLRVARDRSLAEYETAKLAVDRAELDETAARTNVERARIQLERQKLNHSYTRILAPFTGIIASRAIKVGDTVTSGEVLGTGTAAFVLTDPDHLRAVINRPQRELVLFAPSRTVGDAPEESLPAPSTEIIATAEALPGFEFDGLIRLVSPSIDAASGNFRVTIAFDRPADLDGPWLAPGMLVRLEIVTDRHPDALVVPKRAVRREGDLTLLYIVRDDSAVRVEIEPGFEGQDRLEVVPREPGALDAGDLVVVVGNRDLEPGDAVTLVEDVPDTASGSEVETEAETGMPTAGADVEATDDEAQVTPEDVPEDASDAGTAADGARGSDASGNEG